MKLPQALLSASALLASFSAIALGAFPKEWPMDSPEGQGFSSAKLDAIWADLSQRNTDIFVVVRNDKLIYERFANGFDRTKPHGTASLAKALIGGMSLMLATDDGRINPDDKASKYVPQWVNVPGKQDITIRELATHTSGLEDAEIEGQPHDKLPGWKGDFWKRLPAPNDPFTIARDITPLLFSPGTKEFYSNPGMAMLGYCITASLRGAPQTDLRSLLKTRLMDPIGAPAKEWSMGYNETTNVDGLPIEATWGGAAFSANAATRVGRLLIREGDWDEKQLISAKVVQTALRYAGMPNRIGLAWWVNHKPDGNRLWPEVPEDAAWGSGAGEQFLVVVPSLNLIVLRNGREMGAKDHLDDLGNRILLPLMAAINPPTPPPYPQSTVIKSVTWAPKETIVKRAPGSDNWPLAWGDDDAMYTGYGDGNGFEPLVPEKLSLGFAKVTGGPENFTGENVRSATGEQKGNGNKGRKASGMIMIDGTLYMLSRNAGNAQLAWSTDHAQTWTWSDWKFTESFGCPTFVEFGRNYAGARDNFAYVLSPDANTAYDRADRLVLARVPKDHLRDRDAYEFFVRGEGNEQVWSKAVGERGPVFSFPHSCYRCGITYDPALKRYLLNMIGAGGDTRFAGGFGIFDAPEPWGPWTTAYFTDAWDTGPGDTNSFPAKWLSSDGRTAWLVFSSGDHFAVRKATFELGK